MLFGTEANIKSMCVSYEQMSTDEWMDGWMDGWMDVNMIIVTVLCDFSSDNKWALYKTNTIYKLHHFTHKTVHLSDIKVISK